MAQLVPSFADAPRVGARTQSEPSSLTLALIGLVAGALLVGVMTVLGIGPFSDDAAATEGSATFVLAADDSPIAPASTTEVPETTTTLAPTTTQVPETTTTLAPTSTTEVPETTTTLAPTTTQAPTPTPPPLPPPPPPPTTTTTVAPTGQSYLTSISSSTIDQGPSWVAVVTVRVGESGGAAIAGATVSGTWSTGGVAGSCTTDGSGSCTLFQSTLTDADPSTTFVVTAVSAPGYVYSGALTGGSQITVNQP